MYSQKNIFQDFLQFKHEINSKHLQKASVLNSNKAVVAIPNIIISHRKKRQKKKNNFHHYR